MKKVLFILALGTLTLASCKKKYSCACYDIYGNESIEIKKGKNATDACSGDLGDALSFSYCEPA